MNRLLHNTFKKPIAGLKRMVSKFSLLDIAKFLFYAFVFTIPFQIDLVFYTSSIFESGNFNPYTSGFVYLSEILFLAAFIVWGISLVTGSYKGRVTFGKSLIFVFFVLLVISAEVSLFYAKDQFLSFFLLLRLFEFLLLYFFVINEAVSVRKILWIFVGAVLLQALIAISQYIFQGSVGLQLLGETQIASNLPGIAKIQLSDVQLVRPYGTFSHPNILGGFLVVSIFITYFKFKESKSKIVLILLLILLASLILTFSRSAFIAVLVGALCYFSISKHKFSLKYLLLAASFVIFVIVVFNLEGAFMNRLLFADFANLSERVFYFNISKLMMVAYPIGVGLGNFTLNMADFTNVKLQPWDYQPVHNIYMLLSNEIGIIGMIVFLMFILVIAIFLFARFKKAKGMHSEYGKILFSMLVALLVIGLFDHYLISLFQGQVLLFLVIALCGRYVTSRSH